LKRRLSLTEIENVLYHLNYRWSLESLALWKGAAVPFEPYKLYEGYDDFISLETLASIDSLEDEAAKMRLRHALIDHYLQRSLLPHETEMRTWMRGASADVKGEKIYFKDIIPWCQNSSTYETRRILEKETSALCKFLRPFALNYWEILLEILRDELGFEGYIDYCYQKKGVDYPYFYRVIKDLLEEVDDLYFPAMDLWTRRRLGLPLRDLNRFDAIKLLSLSEFNGVFPEKSMEELTAFFRYWDIDLNETPGLYLDLGREEAKSSQAMCFILQIPEESYILMKPEGGWIDLETLWHELGHGLSAVFTSPDLSVVDREMATSYSLSESFAFLLQNLALSEPFLARYLGLSRVDSKTLSYYKVLKDLSIFRRYGAKFLAEYEMFSSGNLSDGEPYAEMMARYTGFYYQPESHLFDLVPEFYCLDYVLGWLGEAMLESHLSRELGADWMFRSQTGAILRRWWKQGNRYDIFEFMENNDLGPLSPKPLLERWHRVLG